MKQDLSDAHRREALLNHILAQVIHQIQVFKPHQNLLLVLDHSRQDLHKDFLTIKKEELKYLESSTEFVVVDEQSDELAGETSRHCSYLLVLHMVIHGFAALAHVLL